MGKYGPRSWLAWPRPPRRRACRVQGDRCGTGGGGHPSTHPPSVSRRSVSETMQGRNEQDRHRGQVVRRVPDGRTTEDQRLLQERPSPTWLASDPWRTLRIVGEFVEGFDALASVGPAVTVFGSARASPDDVYYEQARTLTRRLAEGGFAVITGGGPGVMEAANRGAKEGGGLSI